MQLELLGGPPMRPDLGDLHSRQLTFAHLFKS